MCVPFCTQRYSAKIACTGTKLLEKSAAKDSFLPKLSNFFDIQNKSTT